MLVKQNLSLSLNYSLIGQIDKIKEKLNLSRSEVIEKFLKESLENKLIEDAKILANMNFEDLPTEEEWSVLQSN